MAEIPTDILDMHCHTAGIGSGSECFVSDALRNSWKFKQYLRIFGVKKQDIEAKGDLLVMERISNWIQESRYVSGAVILAMDAVYTNGEMQEKQTEVYVSNELVYEGCQKYPGLYFGASVHPQRNDALEALEKVKEQGAVLIKWLPSIQMIDPANPQLEMYYRKLVELDIPLLTHVGDEDSFTSAIDSLSDPYALELPAKLGVKIIAAHVASSGSRDGITNVQRLLNMMEKHPNIVADISTLTQYNRRKYIKQILNSDTLNGRLLYGTDHPLTNTPLVTPWQFLFKLGFNKCRQIAAIKNPWDRDVELKIALGFPEQVFAKPKDYLLD